MRRVTTLVASAAMRTRERADAMMTWPIPKRSAVVSTSSTAHVSCHVSNLASSSATRSDSFVSSWACCTLNAASRSRWRSAAAAICAACVRVCNESATSAAIRA